MTAATEADEAVYVRPDLLAPVVLRFVESSALSGCTTVEQHPNGWTRVAPRWPVAGWSTGEKLLWRLLTSLVGGDLHEAFDRLDAPSLRAVCDVLAFMREQVA